MKPATTTWGHGETRALFLHGFTGTRDSFTHLQPLLGDLVTATCVDLPGHHGAPVLAQTDDGFVATIDGLAASLEGPHVVVGYSQGARLALGLAVRHPTLVSRLVLESGSPGLRQRHARLERRAADEVLARSLLASGLDVFLEKWERLPLFAGLEALAAEQREGLRSRRGSHSAEGLAWALRALGQGAQPNLWPSLPTMHVPTLLLSGANDEKYSRLARHMATELPLAWRTSLENVGHAPHLEAPRVYATEVRAFLTAPWTHEPRGDEQLESASWS